MKKQSFWTPLLAAVALGVVVGCAATPQHESTGQYVDDTVLTTSVKAAILAEPSLKVAEINVETYKGAVQLSGFVRSEDNIVTAMRVARNVSGVRAVKNDMRLK